MPGTYPKSQARLQWMVDKLASSFGLNEDEKTQDLAFTTVQENQPKIEAFCSDLATPPKLFFFYQPRNLPTPELFISNGKLSFFLFSLSSLLLKTHPC